MMEKLLTLFVSVAIAARHAATVDELLPYEGIGTPALTGPGAVGEGVALPNQDLLFGVVPQTIQIILQLAGTIAFITFVVSGVLLIIAHGNEELQTRAKHIIMYSLIGLIFVVTAYAIVFGIATLSFE